VDHGQLEAVARKRDIVLIVQFGSTVSGATHASSDVDLGVLLAHPISSFGEHADLIADLQRLVPDRAVDVGLLNHADPLFLKQVMDRPRLLYGSPQRLAAFRLYAFKRYQDHRRYLQMERAYVGRAIAALRR
jgi:uncharacterized protein